MVSRKRVIDTKFSVVLKVCCYGRNGYWGNSDMQQISRRIGLPKARHELDDSLDEDLWIKKESRIRYINQLLLNSWSLTARQVDEYNHSYGLCSRLLCQYSMSSRSLRNEIRSPLRRNPLLLISSFCGNKIQSKPTSHYIRGISESVWTVEANNCSKPGKEG